jgi:hypothetical protein
MQEKRGRNCIVIFGVQERRNEQYVDLVRMVMKGMKRNGTKDLG